MPFTHAKVITINDDGNNSTECCVDGSCPCSSLTFALQSVNSNDAIIKIVSKLVTLTTNASTGHSLTISGNGTTIMCNNSGGIYCESCSDVIIEGITWDECSTMHIFKTSRINITNCIYQNFLKYTIDTDNYNMNQTLYIHNSQFNGKEDNITRKCAIIAMTQGSGIVSINNSTFTCVAVNITFQNTHMLTASLSVFGKCSQLLIHAYGDHNSNIKLQGMIFRDNCNYNENTVFISSSTTISCSVVESRFINNNGTALSLSIRSGIVTLKNCSFENNSADLGAAIKIKETTYSATSVELQNTKFLNNSARYYGGAIYYYSTDAHFCLNFLGSDSVIFVNNSAGVAGNNTYISDPQYRSIGYHYQSCRDYDGLPPVSPYHICLYSPPWANCYSANGNCDVGKIMLGESVSFRAAVCDYYDREVDGTELQISCTNCTKYKPAINPIIFDNITEAHIITFRHNTDIDDKCNYNCTLNFAITPQNVNPHELNSSATITATLSPCFSGFVFNKNSQICECFDDGDSNKNNDIIQCNGAVAEIREGFWFGVVKEKHTVSLCPNLYCDFIYRLDAGNGFYSLPREVDDQCYFKTGRACGDCYLEDTLAYSIPVCIPKCSYTWISTLGALMLTFLYWIIVVAGVFGLMHKKLQLSLGNLYGIIYYYSIVDVLLGNNFNIPTVFFLVALISSFAKLMPLILGFLCFIPGLSGIDQQFINYIHVIGVSLMLFGISKAAKYSRRIAKFGKNVIIRAVCVLLLLSYTSLASTSLQLLRPLTFQKVSGVYSYSSPGINYFDGRHAFYGVVAILCTILVIGFPCLLLFEPFLSRKVNFIRIKPLLDQFQGSYKDKYRWFAAYYLICRLVILIIIYSIEDYQYRLYCLQTVCVVIAMIHGWIQPYKNGLLNVSDATILLIMVLVVGLSAFNFPSFVTTTISIVLVTFPLCLLCILIISKKCKLCSWMLKWKTTRQINSGIIHLINVDDQPAVR